MFANVIPAGSTALLFDKPFSTINASNFVNNLCNETFLGMFTVRYSCIPFHRRLEYGLISSISLHWCVEIQKSMKISFNFSVGSSKDDNRCMKSYLHRDFCRVSPERHKWHRQVLGQSQLEEVELVCCWRNTFFFVKEVSITSFKNH